jgi:hypothetical protein
LTKLLSKLAQNSSGYGLQKIELCNNAKKDKDESFDFHEVNGFLLLSGLVFDLDEEIRLSIYYFSIRFIN